MNKWAKNNREDYEINGFISAYKSLDHGRNFKIICKQEQPDYVVEDTTTAEKFGIELTSVYLNDRSVPDVHRKPHNGHVSIPHDEDEIAEYKNRLLDAIKDKDRKANNYNSEYPLLLSIYVNEYCAIHMDDEGEWEGFVRDNENFFDNIKHFCEIVFWNLPNDTVFTVKPSIQ